MAELIRLFEVETPEADPAKASDTMLEALRVAEALLFAASEPLEPAVIAAHLPGEFSAEEVLCVLQQQFEGHGVNLVRVANKWAFRTAPDLAFLLSRHAQEPKKLSRAALETLAIIAYHQPVTRVEIEEIRGVTISKGTLDVLLETGWIRLRGRRRIPGRPLTYGTTEAFLSHFGLEAISDLPGLEELKGAGLLDGRLPAGFGVPLPRDDSALSEDEDPLESPFEEAPVAGAQPDRLASEADRRAHAAGAEPPVVGSEEPQ
jgi:segregation and condensation protein B